mgnify:CR=1 FL=1
MSESKKNEIKEDIMVPLGTTILLERKAVLTEKKSKVIIPNSAKKEIGGPMTDHFILAIGTEVTKKGLKVGDKVILHKRYESIMFKPGLNFGPNDPSGITLVDQEDIVMRLDS